MSCAFLTAVTALFPRIVHADATVVIDGRGFGHGVGLDQEGAYWLAKSGKSSDQILHTFYPGTTMAERGGNVRVPLAAASRAVVALPNGATISGVKVPAGRTAIVTARGGLITATVTAEAPPDTALSPVAGAASGEGTAPTSVLTTPTNPAQSNPPQSNPAPANAAPSNAAPSNAAPADVAPALALAPETDPGNSALVLSNGDRIRIRQVRFVRTQAASDATPTASTIPSPAPSGENPPGGVTTVTPGPTPTTVQSAESPTAPGSDPAAPATTTDPALASSNPTETPDSSGTPDSAGGATKPGAPINISPASVLTITAPVGSTVGVGGKRYRGTLEFAASGGSFKLVNDLDVEWYLLGMGEILTPSWPLATLQSQAIVARTYALRTMALVGQVCPTQACQVYLGAQAEYPKMTQAVQSTAGKVVTYKGRLAATFYSASGGGITATPAEGFGGSNDSMPYLQSIPYPTGDVKAWSVQVSLSELGRRVGYRGTPTGVEITGVGPSGRATEVSVYGSSGTLRVSGPNFDRALGLKSTYFQFRTANAAQPAGSLTPDTLPPTGAPSAVDTQSIMLAPDPFADDPASDPLTVSTQGAPSSTDLPATSSVPDPTRSPGGSAGGSNGSPGETERRTATEQAALATAGKDQPRSTTKIALGAGSLVVVAASFAALLRFARTPRKAK